MINHDVPIAIYRYETTEYLHRISAYIGALKRAGDLQEVYHKIICPQRPHVAPGFGFAYYGGAYVLLHLCPGFSSLRSPEPGVMHVERLVAFYASVTVSNQRKYYSCVTLYSFRPIPFI